MQGLIWGDSLLFNALGEGVALPGPFVGLSNALKALRGLALLARFPCVAAPLDFLLEPLLFCLSELRLLVESPLLSLPLSVM